MGGKFTSMKVGEARIQLWETLRFHENKDLSPKKGGPKNAGVGSSFNCCIFRGKHVVFFVE